MTINLIEAIQKNLGYPALNKVDPNTEDVRTEVKSFGAHSVAQAAIPAILSGLYNFSQSEEGPRIILEGADSTNWVKIIFGNKQEEVVQKVAAYANAAVPTTEKEMEHIANEAIRIMRENVPDKTNYDAVRIFMTGQRNNMLLYLPSSLRIGQLLKNTNMDDNTHKMEGPVSSLMHSIEKQFN